MITIDDTKRPHATVALLEEGSDANTETGGGSSVTTAQALDDSPIATHRRPSGLMRMPAAALHEHARNLPAVLDRTQASTPKGRSQAGRKMSVDRRTESPCSVEETILELYHAGLSRQQLATPSDQPLETRFSPSEVATLHRQVIGQIAAWRKRPITKIFRYVFLTGIELTYDQGSERKRTSVLTAVGVDESGVREVLGVAEGEMDRDASWGEFLQQLKRQGLFGVLLFIGDHCEGLAKRLALLFPGGLFQNSPEQFQREVLSRISVGHRRVMDERLDRIFAGADWLVASSLIAEMTAELKRLALSPAAEFFETHVWESLHYLAFPKEHRHLLRSNRDQLELLRELGERSRMVRAFSDGTSAAHLVSARLRHIESTIWNGKCYARGRL